MLQEMEPGAVCEEAVDAEEALARVDTVRDLDLVLLDLEPPGRPGLEALSELRARHPEIPVAIVSAENDPEVVRRALRAGACGFIPKSSTGSVLRQALQLILAGEVYVPPAILEAPEPRRAVGARELTGRQRQVLALVARGLTNQEIGDVLGIGGGTVKSHVAAILRALEVANRTEAVLALVERGLVDAPQGRP